MKKRDHNIFLIGLMGAGKTTVGRQIAELSGLRFVDSDSVICTRTGVSIPTIFEVEGEASFRDRESAVIEELSALSGVVLATGGGSVMREENRRCLRARGFVVYLHGLPEILFERTRYDRNRPLLHVEDPLQRMKMLYARRDAVYRDTADLCIDVGNQSCQQIVKQILHAVQEGN